MPPRSHRKKSIAPAPPTQPPIVEAPPPPPGAQPTQIADEPHVGGPVEPAPAIGIEPQFSPAPASQPVQAIRANALVNQWLCPNGHILGVVVREKHNGNTYPRLIKFPFAFMPGEYVPANLIISKIDAGEIGCTRCGRAREWIPGQWMIDKLMKRRKHE